MFFSLSILKPRDQCLPKKMFPYNSTIMPKRRRSRSIDDTQESDNNAMVQSAMRKCKRHYMYSFMFSDNTVVDLKEMVRGYGQKGWYNLKKHNLVVVVVLNMCSSTISHFFHSIIIRSRERAIETATKSTDTVCPISLVPVSELSFPYVHDNIVFSRDDLVSFFMSSYNFTNPITRREFTATEIRRFGSPTLYEVFLDRVNLRIDAVYEIQHFAFLEVELENCVKRMASMFSFQEQQLFEEVSVILENTWREMLRIDRHRTLCVLKSMFDFINMYTGRRRKWSTVMVNDLIKRSTLLIT